MLLDIRLNDVSQLAGFTKGQDLEYFTDVILDIEYRYESMFAPTKMMMDVYKSGDMTMETFERDFNRLLEERQASEIILKDYGQRLEDACFLCSEAEAEQCHQRFVADLIQRTLSDAEIIHL